MDGGLAQAHQRRVDTAAEDVENVLHAGLSVDRQAPQIGATNHHGPGAQRDGFDDVAAAAHDPALFRTMFSDPCDGDSSERVVATTAIAEYVGALVGRAFPGADADALSTAIWAVVHGLAFLHLDGKLDTSTPKVVADRVRAAVLALVAVSPAT